ncbi:HAD family phosphatase [Candidatus Parvarchaeota archaeon]|nr:HAD family phosphatase [Candidatus Parvarchaeota archaeon]
MVIKAVIFDLNGTLIDDSEIINEAWRSAAGSIGIRLPVDFDFIRRGLTSSDIITKILKVTNAEEMYALLKRRSYEINKNIDRSLLFPDVIPALDKLKQKHKNIAIASSMEPNLIERLLELTGLKSYVDGVASSKEVKNGKPAPDVFLLAADRLGLGPGECMAVGDSPNDILAGKAAGMISIFLSRKNEKFEGAYTNIKSMEELVENGIGDLLFRQAPDSD